MSPIFWFGLAFFIVSLIVGIVLVSVAGTNTSVLIGAWVCFGLAGLFFIVTIIGVWLSVGRSIYKLTSKGIDAYSAKNGVVEVKTTEVKQNGTLVTEKTEVTTA